ncbi:MAG TPA: thermonuclease family protein [Bacteroidales bacterium]|jgi:endonuclease YncB( thermonuclease family)|nr:thermonuclease family protein [Bacteroidales bacterium]HOS72371.1 thermonuclease family protein [Bacteroidales bacterium]HQH23089.1 thermonuclease family protein [Bacteroidales bacterium]HQJ81053.1 thermonuclease family protein [Bacteroidales bacterium]
MSRKIFLLLIVSFSFRFGFSQEYKGSVIRVIDGDTFVFQTEEGSLIVRMHGIDAPERKQPFAAESADFLKQYLNREASVQISGTDRYGRSIGVLYVNKQDINLLSVRQGFAWQYKQYSSDKKYLVAEKLARKRKRGLWAVPDPLPPWEWRKK